MQIKYFLLFSCILFSAYAKAQKIDKIYINLYTDSLKRGTYNYINIDGHLTNDRYLPLDSTDLTFWASDGKFTGNTLWIDKDFNKEKVLIKVVVRNNPSLSKEFTMYIKQKPDNEILKTTDQLLNELNTSKRKRKTH